MDAEERKAAARLSAHLVRVEACEREIVALIEERRRMEHELDANVRAIVSAMARGPVSPSRAAELTGVHRPQFYRWQSSAAVRDGEPRRSRA